MSRHIRVPTSEAYSGPWRNDNVLEVIMRRPRANSIHSSVATLCHVAVAHHNIAAYWRVTSCGMLVALGTSSMAVCDELVRNPPLTCMTCIDTMSELQSDTYEVWRSVARFTG